MPTRLALSFLLALAPLSLAPLAVAQTEPARAGKADRFVVEPGELTLPALIDRCAAFLDCNILVSPTELASAGQGNSSIKLQKRIETDRTGCEEFFTTMLYRFGFALTPLDDAGQMFEVLSMSGPRGREIVNRAPHRTVEQVLARPNLKVMVTVMVPLQHTNATIATNALRPFFASTGSPAGGGTLTIGNVGNSTAMLVSGMQDQVASAIRLLRECDVPSAKPELGVDQRLDAIERRLKALEERLAPSATQPK
jgi:hypothetical protein